MDPEKLFEEGQKSLARQLENSQYTHVHSLDIQNSIFEHYFLPSAEGGYPPAMVEVANHYLENGETMKAISWAQRYKKSTNCSLQDIAIKFGPMVMARMMTPWQGVTI